MENSINGYLGQAKRPKNGKRNRKVKKFRQSISNIAAEWKRTIHTMEKLSTVHYSTVELYLTVLVSLGKSF